MPFAPYQLAVFLGLICLYLLQLYSRELLTRQINRFSWHLTKSQTLGIALYSFMFFPGTLVHELSHALVATFLGVRIGRLTLFPSFDRTSRHLTLGSLAVAKTDFVRNSLIGAAPTLIGLCLIVFFLHQVFPDFSLASGFYTFRFPLNSASLIILYLVFALANTMHTSASDRQSWPLLLFIGATALVVAVALGRTHLFIALATTLSSVIAPSLIFALGITLCINLVMILGLKLLNLLITFLAT